MTTEERTAEARVRRMAGRQSMTLERSRRRDERASDFGKYRLTATDGTLLAVVLGWSTLAEVEAFLRTTDPAEPAGLAAIERRRQSLAKWTDDLAATRAVRPRQRIRHGR